MTSTQTSGSRRWRLHGCLALLLALRSVQAERVAADMCTSVLAPFKALLNVVGIGPGRAEVIVAARHCPFKSVEDFKHRFTARDKSGKWPSLEKLLSSGELCIDKPRTRTACVAVNNSTKWELAEDDNIDEGVASQIVLARTCPFVDEDDMRQKVQAQKELNGAYHWPAIQKLLHDPEGLCIKSYPDADLALPIESVNDTNLSGIAADPAGKAPSTRATTSPRPSTPAPPTPGPPKEVVVPAPSPQAPPTAPLKQTTPRPAQTPAPTHAPPTTTPPRQVPAVPTPALPTDKKAVRARGRTAAIAARPPPAKRQGPKRSRAGSDLSAKAARRGSGKDHVKGAGKHRARSQGEAARHRSKNKGRHALLGSASAASSGSKAHKAAVSAVQLGRGMSGHIVHVLGMPESMNARDKGKLIWVAAKHQAALLIPRKGQSANITGPHYNFNFSLAGLRLQRHVFLWKCDHLPSMVLEGKLSPDGSILALQAVLRHGKKQSPRTAARREREARKRQAPGTAARLGSRQGRQGAGGG